MLEVSRRAAGELQRKKERNKKRKKDDRGSNGESK
jgi:hypothetical protein